MPGVALRVTANPLFNSWASSDRPPLGRFAAAGDGYALTGDLTIKGVTLPITFDTTFNGSETFPVDGSTHYGFSASATVSRTEFNMNALIPVLSDKVKLELEAQFVHPAG